LDSSFAAACEGLATTYTILAFYDVIPTLTGIAETKRWAFKAIEIEPNSSEAYSALAFSALIFENDWNQADEWSKKSVEINPNNILALSVRSNYLSYVKGDVIQAERQGKMMVQLDPLFFLPHTHIGNSFLLRGMYDSAEFAYRKAIDVNNNSSLPITSLSTALVFQGRPNQAIEVLEKNIVLTGRTPSMLNGLCAAYTEAGKSDQALSIHKELLEMAKSGYVPPYMLGTTAGMTGKTDDAFRYFELAFEQKNPGFYLWKYFPFEKIKAWQAMRKDPRLIKIMDRLAFPE